MTFFPTEEESREMREAIEEFRTAFFESWPFRYVPQFVRWLNGKLTARRRRRKEK